MEMAGRTIDNSPYRFGFNTQEKTDEIAGKGNHNTALFWEYSPRIARRWNVDPVDQIGISNYAAFRNSPISFGDKLGNRPDWVYSSSKQSLLYDSEVKDDQSLSSSIRIVITKGDQITTLTPKLQQDEHLRQVMEALRNTMMILLLQDKF
ncbi:MAG: hypothetical protein EOO20_20190 [Chryseobacterium sp.]|nr:MAG: hypothetical protein EOO20_20190 [Chryseobacterium sp.]